MQVVGVDGCASGWVAVGLRGARFAFADVFATFADVVAAHPKARAIGVDMPLGLVDSGLREADVCARAFLKGRASSVFASPPRPALAARDYAEANAATRRVSGKGLSKQAFMLFPKIREVDGSIADPRVVEVHPEVSFRLMAGGEPVGRKKTWGGLQRRLALLGSEGIELPPSLGAADAVGIDDVVDAAAVAWSARRFARGEARRFPERTTQHDASGRDLAIWG